LREGSKRERQKRKKGARECIEKTVSETGDRSNPTCMKKKSRSDPLSSIAQGKKKGVPGDEKGGGGR